MHEQLVPAVTEAVSGFSGDWDGRRPPVHQPPDPPYTLDQLQAAALVLRDELGIGWKVWAATYPEGPRLIVRKWPPPRNDGGWIIAPTLEEARKRVTEYKGEDA